MPLGLAALDEMTAAFDALRTALDGRDAAVIDAATGRIGKAAAAVRAVGAWRADEDVTARLRQMKPLLEAARVRTAVLADQAGQRLSTLAAQGAATAPLTYGR